MKVRQLKMKSLSLVYVPLIEITKCPLHVLLKRLIPYSIRNCHFMFLDRYWSHIQYQISISCLLIDVDPILPNVHFMFFDRYCSQISKFPFHVSDRYWSHIQYFKNIDGSLEFIGLCLVQLLKSLDFRDCAISKICFKCFGGSLNYLESFGGAKNKHMWFWESWTRPPSPKNIKTMTCWGFGNLVEKWLFWPPFL